MLNWIKGRHRYYLRRSKALFQTRGKPTPPLIQFVRSFL